MSVSLSWNQGRVECALTGGSGACIRVACVRVLGGGGFFFFSSSCKAPRRPWHTERRFDVSLSRRFSLPAAGRTRFFGADIPGDDVTARSQPNFGGSRPRLPLHAHDHGGVFIADQQVCVRPVAVGCFQCVAVSFCWLLTFTALPSCHIKLINSQRNKGGVLGHVQSP